MYRYFLDGILLNKEPQGWDQLITSLKRDRVLKGIIKTIETSLSFRGDGYDYLLNLRNTTSFCGEVALEIQKSCDNGNTYQKFYDGIIFLSDIEFDEKRCLAKSKIQDNSFFAKIYNNKSQEWLPFVGMSKNGISINAASLQYLAYFDPQTGIYYPILSGSGQERTGAAFKLYDVMKFAVAFMTDDTIDFDSITFGPGGDWEGILVTYGLVVSTVQDGLDQPTFEQNFPKMTFEKLFQETDRLINIGFYVDYSTPRPTLFIEADPLMRNSNLIFSANAVEELKTSTAIDYLYSTLLIGSNNFNNDPLLHFPADIDFLGFKSEQYNILGICNLDRQLDLSRDYVVDTNAIESAVVGGDGTFDEEIFLIRAIPFSGNTWNAIETNTLLGSPVPPYYYNEDFTNAEIAKRYLGSVPNSIALWLGNNDERFQATKTDSTVISFPGTFYQPVSFQDDTTPPNFDASGSYNTTTYEYTIPQGGQYSFNVLIKLLTTNSITANLFLDVYDNAGFAGGNLLNSYNLTPNQSVITTTGTAVSANINRSQTINVASGQKIIVRLLIVFLGSPPYGQAVVLPDSLFACTSNITGGGIYQTYDPDDYSILLSKFEYSFDDNEFTAIMSDVRGQISFKRVGQALRLGWIETIKFNHKTGKADITLNYNKTLNGN